MFSKQLFALSHQSARFTLFFLGFIFAFTREANTYFLPGFLNTKSFSTNFTNYIEVLENFIIVVTGAILLQCLNFINIRKILLASLTCYLLTLINIYFFYSESVIKLNLIILAISNFLINIAIILKLTKFKPICVQIIYFYCCNFIGFSFAIILRHFLQIKSININFTIVIISCAVSLLLACKTHESRKNYISFFEISYSSLISKIESILIGGFILGYAFAYIYWLYDYLAVKNSLVYKNVQTVWLFMALSSIISTPLVIYCINRYNKYLLYLFFTIFLSVGYLLFLETKNSVLFLVINSSILGISIYGMLVCSFGIMAEKLDDEALDSAIILFFTILSLGIFFGITLAEKIYQENKESVTLTYNIILIYLGYYAYQFFNKKLYKYA